MGTWVVINARWYKPQLIAEPYLELREVDLSLPSRRCLEPPLELDQSRRAALAPKVRDNFVVAVNPIGAISRKGRSPDILGSAILLRFKCSWLISRNYF